MENKMQFIQVGDLHLKTDYGFKFSRSGWVIEWGGYPYFLDAGRIDSPMALLEVVAHLGAKEWPGADSDNIAEFIEDVCRRKNWQLYGNW